MKITHSLLILLFFWLFCWEIGGQNVPNDWTDIEQDRRLQARTIPVRLGSKTAGDIILGTLIASAILSAVVFYISPIHFQFPHFVASAATGLFLFILPAFLLHKSGESHYAMALFNMASYYPLVMLIIVVFGIAV